MHRTASTARSSDKAGGARLMVVLCSLLLLLPAINVRAIGITARYNLQETEESRQQSEEERSFEDSLDHRGNNRRSFAVPVGLTFAARGASSCTLAYIPFVARARIEHQLRNGVGGPLRC